jgi:asparagine N-glycosylation enzyme membrane subunit Stt3
VRRNKPWFGPLPSIGKAVIPVSWEGYAVTVAFVLGLGLLKLVDDLPRRTIAMALLAAAYGAVVFLTWRNDPD